MCALALIGAGEPQSGLEGLGRVVADEELGDMRGKFVRASGVHFFGIEMLQSWQGADGVTIHATLQFNVDFSQSAANLEGATPRLQVGWSRSCETCGDPTMDLVTYGVPTTEGQITLTSAADALPPGSFATVSGLVQGQQIAGSDNDVRNSMHIAVVPRSSRPASSAATLTGLDTSASQVFDNGDAVHFTAANNELGLAITRGDETVRQAVSGPLNQAAQEVVLQSNLNSVRNQMGITVGLDGLDRLGLPNVTSALSAMKGRGM